MKSIFWFLRKPKTELLIQRTFSSVSEAISNHLELPNYETRCLKVAIIGTPNAGKSTFINNLMDRKVCATSSKVHTTRSRAKAIFTAGDAQIVFIDTPGLVNDREQKKFNLGKTFVKESKNVLSDADLVGVIHDVSNIWTRERLDIKVINLLEKNENIPSFLVLNKVDLLKSKRKLLDITRQVTDNHLNGKPIPGSPHLKKEKDADKRWLNFQEIFMVSSLTGNGLTDVQNYLIKRARPGKWLFPEQVWTDQEAEKIITNAVHAKLLDFLPQEIPYALKPEMEYFNVQENGTVDAAVTINCPSERKAKLVAGASDGKLKQITESLQQDLQDAFQNHVRLKLFLRINKV